MVVRINAATIPITGEITINATTFSTPTGLIDSLPIAANPAPTSPPTSAWLLEVGSPKYHVIRSQIIAPTSAENIIITRISLLGASSIFNIPFPIVAAIAVEKKRGPMRFPTAAIPTALIGVSTLVATTVEIALAESWNPFMKSKNKANIIVNIMNSCKIPPFSCSLQQCR